MHRIVEGRIVEGAAVFARTANVIANNGSSSRAFFLASVHLDGCELRSTVVLMRSLRMNATLMLGCNE